MIEKRVGVIGWPVEHSLSPAMHNAAFAALGLMNWHYELLPVQPDVLAYSLKALRGEGGYIGINVTVPHKQAVIPYVKPDEIARALGAANTIDFRDNSATNTDVVGLIGDLKVNGVDLSGADVLVIGAGGAARAAIYGLVLAGARVVVTNRTSDRAQAMLTDLTISAGIESVNFKSLVEAAQEGASLIVNCTPVGMWPHVDESPWPDSIEFPSRVVLYDMIYRPERTRLMRQVESHGGRAIGGLGMLVRQGAAAFKIWTGVDAPVDVMLKAAQDALLARS